MTELKNGKIEKTYAVTKQTTGNGSSIKLEKGKYSSTWASITFFLYNIKESMAEKGNDNYNLSLDEALAAECCHEAVHASDVKEVNQDIKESQPSYKGRKRTLEEYESKPNKAENNYRKELKEQQYE